METKTFNEMLLRRRNKLNIKNQLAEEDNAARVGIMLKNINALGYTFSKTLIEKMSKMSSMETDMIYKELITCLKEYTGANKTYNVMYPNFPEQVIEADDVELFINAIVHYISNGKLLPQYEKDERLPLFESPKLKVIDFGTDEDLDEITSNLISSKTSLSEQDKEDLIWLLVNRDIKMEQLPDIIPFKENKAIICSVVKEYTNPLQVFNFMHKYMNTATDVLRWLVFESDGDVSLSNPCKFRSFTRNERDLILHLLNQCGSSLEEDMLRYKNVWIKVGERIHPGESKYNKYSNVQNVFNKLRNNIKIETFNGKVEEAINGRNFDYATELLKSRPSNLARKLDELLRKSNDKILIVETFSSVSDRISVPVLLQVREHFKYRSENNNSRVFFPKGSLTKAYTIDNELETIPNEISLSIVDICEDGIKKQFNNKESLNKVYIDDSIKGYCIPQSQRSASSTGMKNVTRGSRFDVNHNDKFIRLAIHWMNELTTKGNELRTDIDLSCSFLDENFGKLDHVSYTNLRNAYSVHSGDLTTAPRSSGGASEFIDINIDKALTYGVRYAAVQIYGYTMTHFCDLDDMLFSWQTGNEQNCGDIFEPSRINHCINLSGNTSCEIPVIFDLKERKVIWCDLALTTNTNFPRCVEGNVRGLSATVMGIVQSHKPQMYELAMLNAQSRGVIVTDRNDADVIFDINVEKPVQLITKIIEIQNEKGEVIDKKTETEEVAKDCKIITPWDVDIWQSDML